MSNYSALIAGMLCLQVGITELPPLDTALIDGDLGWHYHTGGHMATPADWNAFLQFLGRYFKK